MKNPRLFIITLLVLLSLLAACSELETDGPYPMESNAEESETFAQEQTNSADAEASIPSQEDLSQAITAFVEGVMAQDNLPGTAIAVVNSEAVLYAQGFGLRDVNNNLPVTTETLFHIGSTNKSITAMMIATLVDQGYFTWDTPVVEIYPNFALASAENTETVTMRHLLSMQSGIPDYAEDDFEVDAANGEDLFTYIANVPLLGEPGEEFSYSNISASLAGYLGVLAVGGNYPNMYTGYEQLLKQQVLTPIGMKTAVVRVSDAEKNPNYGKSYVLQSGEAVEAEREDFDGDPLAPSGSLKASVEDMAAFIMTQLKHGISPQGVRVVSEENLLETWKPGLENYAMGWEISEHAGVEVLSHEGSFDNYLSVIGFVPDLNIGFVILTNSEEAGGSLIQDGPSFLIDLMTDS